DKDLRKEKLSNRKKYLEELNLKNSEHLQIENSADKIPNALVVAKNSESLYHPGTSKDWLIFENGASKEKSSALSTVDTEARLTHPEKIFFPEEKITKGDVFKYYQKVAKFIVPYLVDRPESLNRHPNGIAQAGFYQKDMTGHIPKW